MIIIVIITLIIIIIIIVVVVVEVVDERMVKLVKRSRGHLKLERNDVTQKGTTNVWGPRIPFGDHPL